MEQQHIRNKKTILQLYDNILPVLAQQVHQNLAPVIPMFHNFVLERVIDTWTKDPSADEETEVTVENGNVQQLGLKLRLEGFERAGVAPFDLTKGLVFKLERTGYTVGASPSVSWLEKDYQQRWEASEYKLVAERWSEELIDELTQRLQDLTS